MDSEERHELKENDLAEMLRNFGDWFNEHGTKLLIAVIIVAAVFTGYNFYTASVQQQYENAWADLASAVTPEDYLQVAGGYDEPRVQALAYLRGADLYRRRAIGRYEPLDLESAAINNENTETQTTDTPAPETDLEQAAAMYRRVLEQDPRRVPAIYHVNALIGLGSVAESRKAWDEARQHYQQAVELGGDQLASLTRQAQRRLDLLDDLRRPIVFAPEPEPGEEPTDPMQHIPAEALEGLEDLEIDLPEEIAVPPADDDAGESGEPETQAVPEPEQEAP